VGSFTLAATGDLLVHTTVAEQAKKYGAKTATAYDFRPMLAPVQGALTAADLAVCHVETPMSPDDRHVSGYPTFNTPPELAAAIRAAGYDSCSVASNHAMDQGSRGVAATLGALDRVGVGHAGTARSTAEARRPEIHLVNGVRVGLLAYTYVHTLGATRPGGLPGLVYFISPRRILADARAAKRASARFVAVSLHWGNEYQVTPTAEQRALARTLLASPDIDLLIGSHAHVVQPVERIGDKYVLYGLGNFLSNESPRCCPAAAQDGVIALVDVQRRGGRFVAVQVRYTPTWVELGTYQVLPVAAALDNPVTPARERAALTASWRRTVAAVRLLGRGAGAARPDRKPHSITR
jgi:poly-gamma-glutamate capsule biosynthesis protein CapA/YwtB (metallophosphatase superfamily)